MSVKIRLARGGRKKRPFYRIVAVPSEVQRNGGVLDILGTYDPLKDPVGIRLDHSKLGYWLGQGAEPSDTVKSLIKRAGYPEGVPARAA